MKALIYADGWTVYDTNCTAYVILTYCMRYFNISEQNDKEGVRGLLTCDDLAEFGVEIDGAGEEGFYVTGGEDRCPWRQEYLEAPRIAVNLQ